MTKKNKCIYSFSFHSADGTKIIQDMKFNKGAYIKYVGGGLEDFTHFSKNIS